jgi:hypothetical protein
LTATGASNFGAGAAWVLVAGGDGFSAQAAGPQNKIKAAAESNDHLDSRSQKRM